MNDWLSVLDWCKVNLPGLLGALVFGYKLGSGKLSQVKAELADEKLKASIKENHSAVDKELGSLSDDDVIKHIINGSGPIEPE